MAGSYRHIADKDGSFTGEAGIPEHHDYCGSCGNWFGGGAECCHHPDELPSLTKAQASAMLEERRLEAI